MDKIRSRANILKQQAVELAWSLQWRKSVVFEMEGKKYKLILEEVEDD